MTNDNDMRSEDQMRSEKAPSERRETPAARRAQITEGDEFAIAGNAEVRGEDPSPDDRDRGETSIKDPARPIDINR